MAATLDRDADACSWADIAADRYKDMKAQRVTHKEMLDTEDANAEGMECYMNSLTDQEIASPRQRDRKAGFMSESYRVGSYGHLWADTAEEHYKTMQAQHITHAQLLENERKSLKK